MQNMKSPWLLIGLISGSFAVASLILTSWLGLHPCHLCIFQRLLFMLIAVLGLMAALNRDHRPAGGLVLLSAAVGAGAAGYQSWLQTLPAGTLSCVSGEPGLIERLVEWLGQQAPALFLATGFCENEELVILGLSLANWALFAFLACLFAAGALLARRSTASKGESL